jgi:hypothetical protein
MAWQSNLDAHCTTAHIGCLSVLMAVVGPSRRIAATQQPRRFDIKADITFGTHAARFMSTRPNLVFSVRALRNDPMQVARDRRRNTLRIFRN